VGPIGVPELIFVFILALLIFGPRKLPELGRTIGKAMTEFRRASADLRGAIEEEMREVERQASEAVRETRQAAALDEALAGPVDLHVVPVGDPPRYEEKPPDGKPESA